MGFIRLVVIGGVVLTILYFAISLYSRSVRREKLENSWEERNAEGDDLGNRDDYIAQGMQKYENGLRKQLILLVYVIPVTAVGLILYFTNN